MPSESGYEAPKWARKPQLKNSGLEIYKQGKLVQVIREISRNKCTAFGRNAQMCDVRLDHPSISRRHAVLIHGSSGNLYVLDLGSTHGTSLNHKRIQKNKRRCLADGDVLKFGASSREYLVRQRLDESSDEEDSDEEPARKKRRRNSDSNPKNEEATKEQVHCRHILVKHKDSRRPRSWKEDEITRTKEEAMEIAEGYIKQIKEKEDAKAMEEAFIELATAQSDCNSNRRGGDLGKFGKGKMQKPFEEAAFALEAGQLSEPVTTSSGIHVIYRIGASTAGEEEEDAVMKEEK